MKSVLPKMDCDKDQESSKRLVYVSQCYIDTHS